MLYFKRFALIAAAVFTGAALIGEELKYADVIAQAQALSAAKKNAEAAAMAEKAYGLKGNTDGQKSNAAYLSGIYYFWAGKLTDADRILTRTLKEDKHNKSMTYEINSVHFNVLINSKQYDRMNQALAAMAKIRPQSKDYLAKKAQADKTNIAFQWQNKTKPLFALLAAKKNMECAAEAEKLYQTPGLNPHQKATAAYLGGVAYSRAGKLADADRLFGLALQEKNLGKSTTRDICSSYFNVLLNLGQKERAEKILDMLKKSDLPAAELQKMRERLK